VKKPVVGFLIVAAAAAALFSQFGRNVPPALIPLQVLRDIVDEASGDVALQNEILLSGVNRNRKPEEYANGYFEPVF